MRQASACDHCWLLDAGAVLEIGRCGRRDVLVELRCEVGGIVGFEVEIVVMVAADSEYRALEKVAPACPDLAPEGPDRAGRTLIEELAETEDLGLEHEDLGLEHEDLGLGHGDPGLGRAGSKEVLRSAAVLSLQDVQGHSKERTGYRSLVD